MTKEEARSRLQALGLDDDAVDRARRPLRGRGAAREDRSRLLADRLARVVRHRPAVPDLLESSAEEGFERWSGEGALGYLVLEEIVRATLRNPPARSRLVVAERCFPSGVLGYWARRLAEGGLVALLTATSPRRLPHPQGGSPLTGTNPLAIAVPSSDGLPLVADVSMGAVTHGDVLAGRARPEELRPFGGEQAHKAFALAAGLELLVGALAGEAARSSARRREARARSRSGLPRAGGRTAASRRRKTATVGRFDGFAARCSGH